MASVKEHYANTLSEAYSWSQGGFANALQRNSSFFTTWELAPQGSGVAIDLGAGCGFQAIPLAQLGYQVTAIDLDAGLLKELQQNAENLNITPVQDDLIHFDQYINQEVELCICMTDTILHLESTEKVIALFSKVKAALEKEGKLILTFRDLTHELTDTDRFIPVRSDANTVFTCFLEYEPETVKVHDIIYRKIKGEWHISKSFYRKLRLSEQWLKEQLSMCGFSRINSSYENGLYTIITSP